MKQALHTLSQHGADVIFADLVKACDAVDRDLLLMKIVARCGCPDELIFVLRKLYSDLTVQLKGCGKGVTIPSTVGGVKQKETTLRRSVLFVFFINAVAESIEPEWKAAGIEEPELTSCFKTAQAEERHGKNA